MATDFERALNFVLDHEGRIFEDVPGDPGGATKDGITHDDYDDFRKEHGLPVHDLRLMTDAEMQEIYTEHYWNPTHAAQFTYPVALALFDTAVNVGTGHTIKWLQTIVGVTPDGGFGPLTLNATKKYIASHSDKALASALMARRSAYYNEIGAPGKTLHKFLKGWLNRVADLKHEVGI